MSVVHVMQCYYTTIRMMTVNYLDEPHNILLNERRQTLKEYILHDSIYIKNKNREDKAMLREVRIAVTHGRKMSSWKRLEVELVSKFVNFNWEN